MVAANVPAPAGDRQPGSFQAGLRGPQGEFLPEVDVTARPVWRLLVRGVGLFLPEWRVSPEAMQVVGGRTALTPPVYLDGGTGFGLQLRLRRRRRGLQPDREIYVRGREDQSFGIVIAGPSAAVGSRVVDAAALVRYGRRLIFQELYDPAAGRTLPAAMRAVRSMEGAVLLDRAAGVGLCAEVDRATGAARCPLAIRFEAGRPAASGPGASVHTYALGSWLAQSVSSHT
ncbi:hypothetical protein [Thermomonospora curvata]|uniref:Uncharacterized protein n=1 Tax=Thermomonospora curvata (strain ATCC 19995 / DSM 43183 / JCM 3096 / KCTC 9072 / NBRC 15933 / NCIMB 10081 / Henssen B9) TaxID=471852 RepID=D1AAY3_THECD|nr:hypothetical protein [Thermomonospora curvata]ACY98926.1 hypothetical protein Tcur_3388 [Thermomonospora curvata DSM 43183]